MRSKCESPRLVERILRDLCGRASLSRVTRNSVGYDGTLRPPCIGNFVCKCSLSRLIHFHIVRHSDFSIFNCLAAYSSLRMSRERCTTFGMKLLQFFGRLVQTRLRAIIERSMEPRIAMPHRVASVTLVPIDNMRFAFCFIESVRRSRLML